MIARAAAEFQGFFCANLAPAKEIDATVLQRADLVIVNEIEAAWYGETLEACGALRFACAAGAVAATRAGAQPSLPTRAEVDALLYK